MEERIVWLSGREGGIGFLAPKTDKGELLMVMGDVNGIIQPGSAYLLSKKARDCITEVFKRFDETGKVEARHEWPSEALWGEGSPPDLG